MSGGCHGGERIFKDLTGAEHGPVPDLSDVLDASARIAPYIHRTPVLTCAALNGVANAEFFFKCENFQKIKAFKIRGAANAVFSLSDAEAVREYGAEIIFCGPRQKDREETLARVLAERGCVLVHPYDDARVIAGQGTTALELLEHVKGLEAGARERR